MFEQLHVVGDRAGTIYFASSVITTAFEKSRPRLFLLSVIIAYWWAIWERKGTQNISPSRSTVTWAWGRKGFFSISLQLA